MKGDFGVKLALIVGLARFARHYLIRKRNLFEITVVAAPRVCRDCHHLRM